MNTILANFDHQIRLGKHSPCYTQLFTTIHWIVISLDNRKQIDWLVLDFSKAFDTLPHTVLDCYIGWNNIESSHPTGRNIDYSENQHLITWLGNWLCGSTQEVAPAGGTSNTHDTQGTVLGLFASSSWELYSIRRGPTKDFQKGLPLKISLHSSEHFINQESFPCLR